MEEGEIIFLNQVVKALEEASLKLEDAYDEKDYDGFNHVKKFIMKIQEKISEVVK